MRYMYIYMYFYPPFLSLSLSLNIKVQCTCTGSHIQIIRYIYGEVHVHVGGECSNYELNRNKQVRNIELNTSPSSSFSLLILLDEVIQPLLS